jgi:rubrerythrin
LNTIKEIKTMPSFPNPFQGNVDRKINKLELKQAIRIDIASELEAIFLYESHAAATDDILVKTVLQDIANEEKAHIGELMMLMRHLEPEMGEFLEDGGAEVEEAMRELGICEADPSDFTVGSTKKDKKRH